MWYNVWEFCIQEDDFLIFLKEATVSILIRYKGILQQDLNTITSSKNLIIFLRFNLILLQNTTLRYL